MYTGSVETETEFLLSLWKSHDTQMADGETVLVGSCPNCRKGNVLTRCTHEKSNGNLRAWRFDHYCGTCGEKYIVSDISSDIFFHKPYKMLETLETPFGDIHVKVNGQIVPFRYRTETYDDVTNAPDKPVLMHMIDIDLSNTMEGDIVFCGFDENILEYNDSDERSVLYSCESNKQILGLGAFEPDDEDIYCYQLEDYGGDGFGYRVTANPKKFDEHHFRESKFATLSVAVLNKADYKDANLVLFLALA
ncbi:hypothetical protein AALA00_12590 [Lachnospiraceae bacterium 46-15]